MDVESLDLGVTVFLITSSDQKEKGFGTGFSIHQDEKFTYILTCAHVIKAVGAIDKVQVNNQPAIVVAQSPENSTDDLAVLKVKGLTNTLRRPLANCGKSKLPFATKGFFLYDSVNKAHKATEVEGRLVKLSQVLGRGQHNFTDVWDLEIEDKFLLQSGYSGSPVVNKQSRTVLGIINYREAEGRRGQAITVDALERVWQEIPSNFVRDTAYNLDAVIALILSVFYRKANQFSSFCLEYFPNGYNRELDIIPQLAYLVIYCHENNEVRNLLKYIKRVDQKQYKKFIKVIKSNLSTQDISISLASIHNLLGQEGLLSQVHKISPCSYLEIFNPFKFKKLDQYIDEYTEAVIDLKREYSKITPLEIEAYTSALSVIVGEHRENLTILDVYRGSIKLKLRLPSNTLDKLIELYRSDRVTISDSGIEYITEVLNEPFNLRNIKMLFENSFSLEELTNFCNQNFGDVSEQLLLDNNHIEIINRLIEYARRESIISELLRLAEERKPEDYKKYSPYFRVPRRPSPETRNRSTSTGRRRSAFYGLTIWEVVKAYFIGVATAVIGLIVLCIVSLLYKGLLASIIFLLGLIVVGHFVGIAVSVSVGRRGGEAVGRIAGISYLIGCVGLPFLLILILSSFNLNSWIIVLEMLLNLFKSRNWLSFAGGSYLAYQRAS